MNWSNVGDFLKSSLPTLGMALTGNFAGAAGSLISNLMGVDDNANAVMSALKSDPNAILKFKLAELETNRDIIIASRDAELKILQTVNKTMQIEIQSDDIFVRRSRPFYGYCIAVSWLIQMIGFTFVFSYTAIKEPENLMLVVQQFAVLSGSLIALWGIALAVLGVSVHKRSQDKQNVLENKAKSLIKNIF